VSFAAAVLCELIQAIAVLTLGDTVGQFLLVFITGGVCPLEVAVHHHCMPVGSDRRLPSGGFVAGLDLLNGVLCFGDPTCPMICPKVSGSVLMSIFC